MPTPTGPKTLKLIAGMAVAAIAVAGCSSGATVTVGDGKGSAFCNDVLKFRDQANALEAAASQGLPALRTQADLTRDQLITLQNEANPADRVNGHPVKDDLQTAVTTYKALAGGLDSADPNDPAAVTKVLNGVQSSEGGAFTTATGRLDSYTQKACGVKVTAATTSTAPAPTTTTTTATSTTSTNGAPTGPVGPVVTGPSPTTSAATTATTGP